MARRHSVAKYVQGILEGNRVLLSQAITLVESRLKSDADLAAKVLAACMPHSGEAYRIGITGVPGVGKSTFIDAFGMQLIENGHQIAVLAVDPSSQKTRGSILGDKTRMERLSRNPAAYVRPSPARDTLGGVERATRSTIVLCEAAGYDTIIVETVGVGQSEVAVHSMVDFFLLLMLAGAGDELQGIKKGIVEMADGMVINKADGDNRIHARNARNEYAKAVHLLSASESGWKTKVLTASALESEGLAEVGEMLRNYKVEMQSSGFWSRQRRQQARDWLRESIQHQLKDHFFRSPAIQNEILSWEKKVDAGKIPATTAARALFRLYLQEIENSEGLT